MKWSFTFISENIETLYLVSQSICFSSARRSAPIQPFCVSTCSVNKLKQENVTAIYPQAYFGVKAATGPTAQAEAWHPLTYLQLLSVLQEQTPSRGDAGRSPGSRLNTDTTVHIAAVLPLYTVCLPSFGCIQNYLAPLWAALALHIIKTSEMKVKRLSGDRFVPHNVKWNLRKVSCSFAEDYCCMMGFLFSFFFCSSSFKPVTNICKISAGSRSHSRCEDRRNEWALS